MKNLTGLGANLRVFLMAGAMGGCSAEAVDVGATISDTESEFTDKYTFAPWAPAMSNVLGIDIGNNGSDRVYTWRNAVGTTGKYCIGTSNQLCSVLSNQNYTCPGTACGNIRGIAIAKNTQRVFTWWKGPNGAPKVSEGTSNNLRHHVAEDNFVLPAWVPSIDRLQEVAIWNNGWVVYYWWTGEGGRNALRLTAGDSRNAASILGADQGAAVTVPDFVTFVPDFIAGIATNAQGSSFTWFTDSDRTVAVGSIFSLN